MKMEQTECSETSAYKIQTPGIYPKKAYNIQNTAKAWKQKWGGSNLLAAIAPWNEKNWL